MIQYVAEGVNMPAFKKREINRWITEVAASYARKVGEIVYIFCSNEKMLELNKQYLNHDDYTDVISFDYSEKEIISGDIFVGVETVKSNSEKFGVSFEEELMRILIHGILHLCGQDDKTPELRLEMTEKENQALSRFEHINI